MKFIRSTTCLHSAILSTYKTRVSCVKFQLLRLANFLKGLKKERKKGKKIWRISIWKEINKQTNKLRLMTDQEQTATTEFSIIYVTLKMYNQVLRIFPVHFKQYTYWLIHSGNLCIAWNFQWIHILPENLIHFLDVFPDYLLELYTRCWYCIWMDVYLE